jgi:hypothetical protein
MSRTVSPSTGRRYGLALACRAQTVITAVWSGEDDWA